MIGRQHGEEQRGRVAVQFTQYLGGEFVVREAQRRDPGFEREWGPVAQVSREVYEFFSLALADFSLLAS